MLGKVKVAVIGGTGIYDIDGLYDIKEVSIDTPYGLPSDNIIIGTLSNTSVAFLPRHKRGHTISPTEIPSRANIYALKKLGVECIIAINSVGSYKEELCPGDILLPDQFIDRTSQRINTFYNNGIVAHVQFADPICGRLRNMLYDAAKEARATVHNGGTYVVIEGSAFSTRAESNLYRSFGADVIGMTALPEAKLAREAEICYAIIACVTDYDCWRENKEVVSVDMILDTLKANTELAKRIIKSAISKISDERECGCATAMENAIVSDVNAISDKRKKELDIIIGKYLK